MVAHPDDETFGLGAVADSFTTGGAAVHVLCFTHGEASTLNENHAAAAARPGSGNSARPPPSWGWPPSPCSITPTATLLRYRRAKCPARSPGWPCGPAPRACWSSTTPASPAIPIIRPRPVPPMSAALAASLPVLAWALPDTVAGRLRAETGARVHWPAARPGRPVRAGGPGPPAPCRAACTPARSHRAPSCGGGCSCKVTASTCAGCSRPGGHPGAAPGRPRRYLRRG